MTELQYKGYKIEGVGKGKADYYVYTDLCKGCGLCIAKNACSGQRKSGYTRPRLLLLTLKYVLPAEPVQ